MRPNVMMLDGAAFMPSLAALDVIVSTSKTTPIVDEQTKIQGANAAIAAAESAGIPTQDQTTAAIKAANAAVADAKAKSIAATAQSIAAAKAAAENVGAGPDARADQAAAAAASDVAAAAAKTLKEVTAAAKEIRINADPDVIAAKENQASAVAEVSATNQSLIDALTNLESITSTYEPSVEVTQALRDATIGLDTNAGLSVLNPVPVTTAVTTTPVTTASVVTAKPDPTKTSYADLTPAQRAAMTQNEKLDYLQAARDFKFETEAAARGASNPMLNYFVRPEAPQVPGMIQYYSWIGGRTTGEWRLYGAVDNDANRALYGGRAFAGETQATAESITGANSLKNQPTFDPTTNTWKPAVTTATTTAVTTTAATTTASTSTTQVTANPADYSTVNGVLMYKGSAYTGDYQGKKYINGQVVSSEGTGVNFSGSGTSLDPFMESGKAFTGTKFGSTYVNGVIVNMAQKTADDIAKQGRLDARTEFGNTLKALGLPQDLIDEIDTMIKQDYTNSQMYLELQKTTAWKNRFPGMAALSAAGKAIDAGTYISQEKSMLQTLDYYGLDKNLFGTTAELGKQIANLVSPKRFETVVALAAQDVEQNPDVLSELNLYYGVDKSAAIAYLLNPTIGLDIIQRQARAAEIGAKAGKSKFDFGVSKEGYGVAESFINAAGTMDLQSLDVAFQQARGLADTQANIAATEGAAYNDLSAVSAILGKDQAAILDSQRRAARSVARFSGGSGLGSGSLKTESSI